MSTRGQASTLIYPRDIYIFNYYSLIKYMAANCSGKGGIIMVGVLLLFVSLTLISSAAGHNWHPSKSDHEKRLLRVGFYKHTCPSAEAIVHQYVNKFYKANPTIAPALIRLHFHDCFVRGCDASVLLDGPNSEKESIPNKDSLRGIEVIDAIKTTLELRCPRTVSCADILAFAARDSSWKSGRIYYQVPSGRRDGYVSNTLDPLLNLPPPFFNATQLIDNFATKNLTLDEMVTLSGAHSIGIAHCSSFSDRLYPVQDPTLNPAYAAYLKKICPDPEANGTVNQDPITPNRLDNKYCEALKAKKGLLTSDQVLLTSPLTSKAVLDNAAHGHVWDKKFAAAMVKMEAIEVLTGTQGQIRNNCRLLNSH